MENGQVSEGTRYTFLRRIASGGMADLFEGEASAAGGIRKRVAIKRIRRRHADDDEFTAMFLTEARLASTLQHPNIVQTYDVLHQRGEYFIIMELLHGMNLHRFRLAMVGTQHAMLVDHVLHIVNQVLSALHHAHERKTDSNSGGQITHRDVTPDNIFVTRSGGIKLLDFGIAKQAGQEQTGATQSGVIKGKVAYMAPEQCQAGEVDRRTDLYSVGVVLYRMLTGELPFRGKNPYDTMRVIIHEEAASPKDLLPELPQQLSDLVMKALAKKPSDRFNSAREMQAALSACIRGSGFYVTDMEFTGLVEGVMSNPGPRHKDERIDDGPLPADLVIGAIDVPKELPNQGLIVATKQASVERIEGVTVLSLRGNINESFDPATLIPHLDGDILLQTEHLKRVTSFGVRGLTRLFEETPSTCKFHHVRCSVPFLQQAAMIRGLLGGGEILSFFLPYVDPESGNAFEHLATREQASKIIETGKPPMITCPGFPNRMAEFDDDPDYFFSILKRYQPNAAPKLLAALAVMNDEDGKLFEKIIEQGATKIVVRRPLRADLRWRRAFRGVEGKLIIDLKSVPFWDDAGVELLLSELDRIKEDLVGVQYLGAPGELYEQLRTVDELLALGELDTVRVNGVCQSCGTPRQVLIDSGQIAILGALDESCPRCDGALELSTVLQPPKVDVAVTPDAPNRQPASPPTDVSQQGQLVLNSTHGIASEPAQASSAVPAPTAKKVPALNKMNTRGMVPYVLLVFAFTALGASILLLLIVLGLYLR